MSLIAIELNDVGIRVAASTEDGLLPVDMECHASPGWARIGTDPLITGLDAARQARLHPLQISSRFWDQLDMEPADSADRSSPNHAEVACAHLQHMVSDHVPGYDEIVFAVPSFYDTTQLRILAGIARELGLPVTGMITAPVAVDADPALQGTFLHLDLWLHRTVLSVVDGATGRSLRHVQVCPNVGLNAIRAQWIRALADEFVRHTRFDPLHDHLTEQQLHDRLDETLDDAAAEGASPISIDAGSQTHRITVTDEMFAHWSHNLVFQICTEVQSVIAQHDVKAIALSADAARVPGLHRTIQQQAAVPVHHLEAGAAALALLKHWPGSYPGLDLPGVSYHTRREIDIITS